MKVKVSSLRTGWNGRLNTRFSGSYRGGRQQRSTSKILQLDLNKKRRASDKWWIALGFVEYDEGFFIDSLDYSDELWEYDNYKYMSESIESWLEHNWDWGFTWLERDWSPIWDRDFTRDLLEAHETPTGWYFPDRVIND